MKSMTMLVLLLAAAPALGAPISLAPSEGSVLWIEGDSTLHPYSSTTTAVALEMTLDRAQAEGLAAAVARRGAATLTLRAPVASLKSAHKQLDKNLRKALKADKHPDIVFELERYEIVEPGSVLASGRLTIAGTTKPAAVKGRIGENNGRLVVEGEHPMLMSDFGIQPPKMMMGAIKTADKVVVKFRLLLGAGG